MLFPIGTIGNHLGRLLLHTMYKWHGTPSADPPRYQGSAGRAKTQDWSPERPGDYDRLRLDCYDPATWSMCPHSLSRRPFNALLSFGYALLYRSVLAAVLAVGLKPSLGFFHTPRSTAHPPLA